MSDPFPPGYFPPEYFGPYFGDDGEGEGGSFANMAASLGGAVALNAGAVASVRLGAGVEGASAVVAGLAGADPVAPPKPPKAGGGTRGGRWRVIPGWEPGAPPVAPVPVVDDASARVSGGGALSASLVAAIDLGARLGGGAVMMAAGIADRDPVEDDNAFWLLVA